MDGPRALRLIAWVLGAYACGAVPYGVLFARARGVDLRASGSGNIGATNAARVLGKRIGALVFLCDAAKGWLPVVLARSALARGLGPDLGAGLVDPLGPWALSGVAAVGAAAFLGHLTTPFLRFRGGKGVATAFGVFLAVAPGPAAFALGIFALTYALTRLSSLGSLLSATAFTPALYVQVGAARRDLLALSCVLWLLIVWRHRDNLGRLLRRTEGKV